MIDPVTSGVQNAHPLKESIPKETISNLKRFLQPYLHGRNLKDLDVSNLLQLNTFSEESIVSFFLVNRKIKVASDHAKRILKELNKITGRPISANTVTVNVSSPAQTHTNITHPDLVKGQKLFDVKEISARYVEIMESPSAIDKLIPDRERVYKFVRRDLVPLINHGFNDDFNTTTFNNLKSLVPPYGFQGWKEKIEGIEESICHGEFKNFDMQSKLLILINKINDYTSQHGIIANPTDFDDTKGIGLKVSFVLDKKIYRFKDRVVPTYFTIPSNSDDYVALFHPVGAITVDMNMVAKSCMNPWLVKKIESNSFDLFSKKFAPEMFKVHLDIARELRGQYSSHKEYLPLVLEDVLYEEYDHAVQHTRVEDSLGRKFISRDTESRNRLFELLIKDDNILNKFKMHGARPAQDFIIELLANYSCSFNGSNPLIRLFSNIGIVSNTNALDNIYTITGKSFIQTSYDELYRTKSFNFNDLGRYDFRELAMQSQELVKDPERLREGARKASEKLFKLPVGSYTLEEVK